MYVKTYLTIKILILILIPCLLHRKPSTCTTTSLTEQWARPYGRTSSLRLTPSLLTRASQGWTWGSADLNSTLRYEQQHQTRAQILIDTTGKCQSGLFEATFHFGWRAHSNSEHVRLRRSSRQVGNIHSPGEPPPVSSLRLLCARC